MKEIRLQVTTNPCTKDSNFWYVRVRTSETPLLYKSNEKLPKILKINFCRTLEINQKLVTIQVAFIQEKNDLIMVRTASLVEFN